MTHAGGPVLTPGWSSRSTIQHFRQFPHRDEMSMSNGMEEAGWSNSSPVEDAPKDVHPDVAEPEVQDPGFSNKKAVGGSAESKVVNDDSTEDKAVAKKSAAKKKG